MICAIIDVGSNSIRLSVYKTTEQGFTRLFSEKNMAGLAGYVAQGVLSPEGIARAGEVLSDFRKVLENFEIDRTDVFATASLRNITNTTQAVQAIEEASGFSVEVLSGYEEALYGYYGAMVDCNFSKGVLMDVGGGSTEAVYFEDNKVKLAQSMPAGSLSLYTKFVSKLLPKNKEYDKMREQINYALNDAEISSFPQSETIYGVGGTARAALKLTNNLFLLERGNRTITMAQLSELRKVLCGHDEAARKLIIKTCAERVHTIVPGILIVECIAKKLDAKQLIISQYGVREGFLCRRILNTKS
jgi:exopolyphosphatase/guanosine-5'-triphosphate,3'-diphosphate pyrophosphatase